MVRNANNTESGARMQTLLAAFRHIGMPLLQALAEASNTEADEKKVGNLKADAFSALIDSTVTLSRELAGKMGAGEDQLDAWVRWALAGSASQVVAASYRATGHAMSAEEAVRLAEVAATLQEKFKSQIPTGSETMPNNVGTFRAKMMESMVPVIGAVAAICLWTCRARLVRLKFPKSWLRRLIR